MRRLVDFSTIALLFIIVYTYASDAKTLEVFNTRETTPVTQHLSSSIVE